MANELKKLIREAFNTAYLNHKKINESAESIGASLSPAQKAEADKLINTLVNKGPGYQKIEWDPSGESQGIGTYIPVDKSKGRVSGNRKVQDYIVESIFESYRATRDDKYRDALASFFRYTGTRTQDSDGNPVTDESPMWKIAKQRFMGGKGQNAAEQNKALERLEANKPGSLFDFVANSWEKTFSKKHFDSLVDNYKDVGGNFGRFITNHIMLDLRNQIRDATGPGSEFGAGVTSMDAPSSVTGKASDFGGENGDAAENNDEDSEAQMSGVGATDDTYNRDEDNLYQKERGSEYEKITDEPGTTDDAEARRKESKQMITALFKSLFQAIKEFREYHEPSANQEKAFVAIEKLMRGSRPKELSQELGYNVTTFIQDLKKSKEFVRIADDYLLANGFINSRGKAESFVNVAPIYIADAAKYFKTKDTGITKDLDTRDRTSYVEDVPEDEKDVKRMMIFKNSIKRGMRDFLSSGNITPEQQQGLKALELILNTGASADEISAELGHNVNDSINLLNHDGNFLQKINNVLIQNLAKNIFLPTIINKHDPATKRPYTKEKAMLLAMEEASKEKISSIDPDYLTKVSNFIRTGSESSLAEMSLNEFIENNFDVIMERVYKRLSSKLNS